MFDEKNKRAKIPRDERQEIQNVRLKQQQINEMCSKFDFYLFLAKSWIVATESEENKGAESLCHSREANFLDTNCL